MYLQGASRCGITKCEIKTIGTKGCGTGTPSYLKMGAKTPWAVTATSNIEMGWTESACMQCYQSDNSRLYQNIKVT